MTDLIHMTKPAINALLASPLSTSKLKKTSKDDLIAIFDAVSASDSLATDLRGAFTSKRTTAPKPRKLFKRSPSAKGNDIKPVRAGSKRAALLDALFVGATVESCAELLTKKDGSAWSPTAQRAALTTFWTNWGYGVEERADGDVARFHLILPKGIDAPVIV